MLQFVRKFFTKHIGLKLIALILALMAWFFIVNELKKGSQEEMQMMRKMLPSEGLVAKKLMIRPILIGKPRRGYKARRDKAVIVPDYCIVVGTRDMLGKIKFAYTTPIDVRNAYRTITTSIPLNPIAPGVYMEETLVQVTVPIEKETE